MGRPKRKSIKNKSKYAIEEWTGSGEGERILIYGDSGMGKTTLASTAPDPAYIGLDQGGSKIRNPITGKPLNRVTGVETFNDVRGALQHLTSEEHQSVVIDTVTFLQDLAKPYMFNNIAGPRGKKVKNIVAYGYNKGYQHLYDTMKLILQDCDRLIRAGKNVILIAQQKAQKTANPAGEDYLRDGPRLYDGNPSTADLFCEWADHVLRIAYLNVAVEDKKAAGTTERAVFVQPEVYFRAKSRTIHEDIVSFEGADDTSIWDLIFGGE